MEIFMLIMFGIILLGLISLCIFLLSYYSLTDERGFGTTTICKFVVVLGMFLSFSQVFCLPLDVYSVRSGKQELEMDLIWKILYISSAIYIFVINPLISSFYEANEDDSFFQKLKYAICYLCAFGVISNILVIISYGFFGIAEVPVHKNNCNLVGIELSNKEKIKVENCKSEYSNLEIHVSLPIYYIGILSFFSWFFFMLFGGIGLSALPMDLIQIFSSRPKEMSKEAYENLKNSVISRANQMKALAMNIKQMEEDCPNLHKFNVFNSKKRKHTNDMNKLKANCLVLENDNYILKLQDFYQRRKYDVGFFYYYLCLFLGILSFLISLIWFIHILLYVILQYNNKPAHLFINEFLLYFEESPASFVSTITFSSFCMYLLLATIKGSIKFGIRFACWTVHPMKKDGTPMNSLLFNTCLILLSSISVTHFCSRAFREYVSMTDIDIIFGTQIRYLKFFKYFYTYNIFIYGVFSLFIISFIYLLIRPNDRVSLESQIGKSGPSEALMESVHSSGLK